jgi:2,3-dihydroxybenzoate decarboxylase
VDWPFIDNALAAQWIASVPLCEEDRVRILSGNAKRLLRM